MSNYEVNKGDQIFIAVDVSGSMRGESTVKGKNRMEIVQEKITKLLEDAAKIDDKVNFYTFGQKIVNHGEVTLEQAIGLVAGLQANEGSTHTHQVVQAMYDDMQKARAAGETNNLIGLIITDGEPTGESNQTLVGDTLRAIADAQTDGEGVGFSFLQVGNDPGAAAFLKFLDDDLGAKVDIVDTKQFEETDFVTAAAGAILD